MKHRFQTNDYFPHSAIQEAKQYLSHDFADHENLKKALKTQCEAIEKKGIEVEFNEISEDSPSSADGGRNRQKQA